MVGFLVLARQWRLARAHSLPGRAGEVRTTDSLVPGALELARRRRAAAEGAGAPGRGGPASGVRDPDGPDPTLLRGGEGTARGINCGAVRFLTKSENSFGVPTDWPSDWPTDRPVGLADRLAYNLPTDWRIINCSPVRRAAVAEVPGGGGASGGGAPAVPRSLKLLGSPAARRRSRRPRRRRGMPLAAVASPSGRRPRC